MEDEKQINVQPYANGIQASCKYRNRRIYVFYNYKTMEYTTEIKAYFGKSEGSFAKIKESKGVQALCYKTTLETTSILFSCQNAIFNYLESQQTWTK